MSFSTLSSGISQKQSSTKRMRRPTAACKPCNAALGRLFPSTHCRVTAQLNLQEEWVGRSTNQSLPPVCKHFDKDYDIQAGIFDGGFSICFVRNPEKWQRKLFLSLQDRMALHSYNANVCIWGSLDSFSRGWRSQYIRTQLIETYYRF